MDSVLNSGRVARVLPHPRPRSVLLLLILVAISASRYFSTPPDVVTLPAAQGCMIEQAACRADLAAGVAMEFSLAPRPLTAAAPLEIRVRIEGLEATNVRASFRGVAMSMGMHEVDLAPLADGSYLARTALPVCVSGRMQWEATIEIDTGARIFRQPFRFESGA